MKPNAKLLEAVGVFNRKKVEARKKVLRLQRGEIEVEETGPGSRRQYGRSDSVRSRWSRLRSPSPSTAPPRDRGGAVPDEDERESVESGGGRPEEVQGAPQASGVAEVSGREDRGGDKEGDVDGAEAQFQAWLAAEEKAAEEEKANAVEREAKEEEGRVAAEDSRKLEEKAAEEERRRETEWAAAEERRKVEEEKTAGEERRRGEEQAAAEKERRRADEKAAEERRKVEERRRAAEEAKREEAKEEERRRGVEKAVDEARRREEESERRREEESARRREEESVKEEVRRVEVNPKPET